MPVLTFSSYGRLRGLSSRTSFRSASSSILSGLRGCLQRGNPLFHRMLLLSAGCCEGLLLFHVPRLKLGCGVFFGKRRVCVGVWHRRLVFVVAFHIIYTNRGYGRQTLSHPLRVLLFYKDGFPSVADIEMAMLRVGDSLSAKVVEGILFQTINLDFVYTIAGNVQLEEGGVRFHICSV